jgi:zinc transport system permease protein
MNEFALRAAATGALLALVAGPLGCFVVWRRMAYFGEALAHSALLGAALGLLLGLKTDLAMLGVCVALAALLPLMERQRLLAQDTLIGILAQGALALGVVLIGYQQGPRVDLYAYLFGDILAVRSADLLWMAPGALLVLAVLTRLWRSLLSIAVDEDLAHVEGVNVQAVRMAFMLIIAVVVAAAAKLVGVLLVTAMLIIPAATARRFSRTPERMAQYAVGFGLAAVLGGVAASFQWDTPTGPSIVLAAVALFGLSHSMPMRAAS